MSKVTREHARLSWERDHPGEDFESARDAAFDTGREAGEYGDGPEDAPVADGTLWSIYLRDCWLEGQRQGAILRDVLEKTLALCRLLGL